MIIRGGGGGEQCVRDVLTHRHNSPLKNGGIMSVAVQTNFCERRKHVKFMTTPLYNSACITYEISREDFYL